MARCRRHLPHARCGSRSRSGKASLQADLQFLQFLLFLANLQAKLGAGLLFFHGLGALLGRGIAEASRVIPVMRGHMHGVS